MSGPLPLGGAAWRQVVFGTPPVLDHNSRTRPTLRFAPRYGKDALMLVGQNQLLTTWVLDYLTRAGVVLRWKVYPFEWTMPEATKPSVPDFLVELAPDRRLVVIQAHAQKFLTPKVQATFDAESAVSKIAGMDHLVWTDLTPLGPGLRDLFAHIRRASRADEDEESLARLVEAVTDAGMLTITQIVEADLPPSLVAVGVHKLRLFVLLDRKLDGSTIVTVKPQTDGRAFLMMSAFDPESWWNSLEGK